MRVSIQVNYDLEIDDEDIDWLMRDDDDVSSEKKYVLREYRNRQNPYLEFTLKCDDKTGYFETY
jgi:hypothetical protein